MYVCSNSLDKDYDMYVTVFIYSDVGCYGEGGNVECKSSSVQIGSLR